MNKPILRCTKSVFRRGLNNKIESKFEVEEYVSVFEWHNRWRKTNSEEVVDRREVPILGKLLSVPEKEELLACNTQEEVDEFIRQIEGKN